MSNHAAGPWHASDPDCCEEVLDSNGRTIAVVENWDTPDRANTNLIAAAPELLAALEDIRNHCRMNNMFIKSMDYMLDIEAIIAKAKGE